MHHRGRVSSIRNRRTGRNKTGRNKTGCNRTSRNGKTGTR